MGGYQLPSAQKNEVNVGYYCLLDKMFMCKQNWLAYLRLFILCWKAEEHWEGDQVFFDLVHSCKEPFVWRGVLTGKLTFRPFQKAILVSKEFSFIYSFYLLAVAFSRTRLGGWKSTSWKASRNLVLFYGFFPIPTPRFFPWCYMCCQYWWLHRHFWIGHLTLLGTIHMCSPGRHFSVVGSKPTSSWS